MTTTSNDIETWDDAAEAVVDEIWSHGAGYDDSTLIPTTEWLEGDLGFLGQALDDGSRRDVDAIYLSLAEGAVRAYAQADANAAEHFLYQKVLPTLIDRHHKYGPGNINRRKHLGLEVRLSDKVERWKNYERTGKADFADESLVDVLVDIVGYCAIGLLLTASLFDLDLAGEQ